MRHLVVVLVFYRTACMYYTCECSCVVEAGWYDIYKNCWGESYWCSVDEDGGGRDAVEDDTVERGGDAVAGGGGAAEGRLRGKRALSYG